MCCGEDRLFGGKAALEREAGDVGTLSREERADLLFHPERLRTIQSCHLDNFAGRDGRMFFPNPFQLQKKIEIGVAGDRVGPDGDVQAAVEMGPKGEGAMSEVGMGAGAMDEACVALAQELQFVLGEIISMNGDPF